MNLLASFAPFIVFAVLLHLGYTEAGLWAAAAAAVVLLARDVLVKKKSMKILEVGTVLLFAGLGLATEIGDLQWTIPAVRLVVDTGLLVIVLVSVAIGQPFTLQYARESVAPSLWSSPEFMAVNRKITLVWAAAFAAMAAADLLMIVAPLHHGIGVAITVIALVAAFKYTQRHSEA